MAEKNLQVYPLAPANGDPRSDEESLQQKELKKKKRLKCFAYIVAFAVFQTGVILLFALTVMKIKTPKVRFDEDTVLASNLLIGSGGSSDFNMSLSAKLTVKNTNFGHYKFEETTGNILHDGVNVGEFTIPKARARARSTKKIDIVAAVKGRLGSDNGSGSLTLNSQAKLTGKVILMKVMKKKKSAEMNCTLVFNVNTKLVTSVTCK